MHIEKRMKGRASTSIACLNAGNKKWVRKFHVAEADGKVRTKRANIQASQKSTFFVGRICPNAHSTSVATTKRAIIHACQRSTFFVRYNV